MWLGGALRGGGHCLLLLFMALVMRKAYIGMSVLRYVHSCGDQLSQTALEESADFHRLIDQLRDSAQPSAVLLLNQHALDMTFNFLCNTRAFPDAHRRFLFVTLDAVAHEALKKRYPSIRLFHWPTPCLQDRFNFASGPYQSIYVLRANLCTLLAKHGISFWMMQQDTFWRTNFFNLNLELEYAEDDILFDRLGHADPESRRSQWINGANFFVRASNRTVAFFNETANKLTRYYSPDMGIMCQQCHTWKKQEIKCNYMPHRIAHSWEWLYTDQSNPPSIIQLDCETNTRSKLSELAQFGFDFLHEDRTTCNDSAVLLARHRTASGQVHSERNFLSFGRGTFTVYWAIADFLIDLPLIGSFMKVYLPMLGFYMIITL